MPYRSHIPQNDRFAALNVLAPYLQPHRIALASVAASILAVSLATLALPLIIRHIIDDGFASLDSPGNSNVFSLILLAGLALGLASAFRLTVVNRFAAAVTTDLMLAVHAQFMALGPAYLQQLGNPEAISRLSRDGDIIQAFLSKTAPIMARNAFICAGAICLMIRASPALSAIMMALIPLLTLILILFGRQVRALSMRARTAQSDTLAIAIDSLTAVATVQACNAETRINSLFREHANKTLGLRKTAILHRAGLTAAIIMIIFMVLAGVLWFGGELIATESLTPGALGQFILALALASAVLNALSESWGESIETMTALERIGAVLTAKTPTNTATTVASPKLNPKPAALALNRVSFTYPHRKNQATTTSPQKPILKDISLNIDRGEKIAIIGPSGAGKSTLIQLLQRFYDPDQGEMILNGDSYRDITPSAWRRRLAVIPQDPYIFNTDLETNIRYAAPDIDDSAYRAVIAIAPIKRLTDALPHGSATRLGAGGVDLSGGQRQAIAWARILLRDAPILLLDEATSALDAASEAALVAALTDRKHTTIITIAHRLATIMAADRIIVMDQGRIIDVGKHETLMQRNPLYQHLATLQAIPTAATTPL